MLETPAGRESLVGFARLRAELTADAPAPTRNFVARMEARLSASRRRALLGPLVAVAAGLLLGVALTTMLRPISSGVPGEDAPTRGESPPEATRVLRFEPGSDWMELGS